MNKIIEIENLNFGYDGNRVLENINLEIREKDFWGIIGPNGSGKTTLLKIMLGMLKPNSGKIKIFGKESSQIQNLISYVPQFGQMEKDFPIRAFDVVAMGLCNALTFFPRFNKAEKKQINIAMKNVGINDIAEKPYGELSGGQKQRCLIARAIVSEPKILFLDEPTASVDSTVEEDVFELFKKLNQKITIILVSHDIGFISSYVNKIACVNRTLVCHGIEEISNRNIIEEAYSNKVNVIKHKCGL